MQIEVKRAQPKGRERDQPASRGPDRNYGGGAGNYGQNGFSGGAPNMMNMYGGMTPALMAQWYQRMQAYYATMGRGMMPSMGMGNPMMGMPNANMQGMGMGGGMPQMMGMQPGMGGPAMGGYPPQMAMNQGYGSPPQQQYQEPSSHEGEYTYDEQPLGQQSPPPSSLSPETPAGPRGEGPPPNAPTGPSGLKPNYGGGQRGRGMPRGGGRGYGGGQFPGGMNRGSVRYNPYSR